MIFFAPAIVKYMKKTQYSETLWLQTYFASPLALWYFEVPLHGFSNKKDGIWAKMFTWIIKTQEYNCCVVFIFLHCEQVSKEET